MKNFDVIAVVLQRLRSPERPLLLITRQQSDAFAFGILIRTVARAGAQ